MMTEGIVIGFLAGIITTSLLCQWSFRKQIEYKADTLIDMCLNGKFYSVRRNKLREKNG